MSIKREIAESVALAVLVLMGWTATVVAAGITLGVTGLVAWHVFRWLA